MVGRARFDAGFGIGCKAMASRWLPLLPALAFALALSSTALKPRVVQDGCDSPAHLLLSESWFKAPHQAGSPELRAALARSLAGRGFPLEEYSRSLGPLCTHWNGSHQYNQYPPGLPVALSFAPLPLRGLWFGTIVFAIYLMAGAWSRRPGPGRGDLFIPLLAVSPLVLPILFPFLVSFHGMVVCFGLMLLIVISCVQGSPGEATAGAGRDPDAPGWLVGILVALCLLTRYDTIIPLASLAIILSTCGLSRRFWGEALGVALALGVLPLALYQRSALGTAWRPVTPSYDLAWASGPRAILDNAIAQLGWFNLRFFALWLLGVMVFRPRSRRERRLKSGWMIASGFGFLFVCAKEVQSSYYLWPWAAMGFGFFLVGASRADVPRWARTALATSVLAWALVNTVVGLRVQAEQARQYRQLARRLRETWPPEPRAWIFAGSYSGLVEAMRIHLGLSFEPIVVDGGHTPAEVARQLDALLSAKRVPVYRFDPADLSIRR